MSCFKKVMVCFVFFSCISFVFAKPAPDNNPILIGMSTSLTGPARALGCCMRLGVQTYFKKINEEGGVDGRSLKLIALDDTYEPRKTLPNMLQLILKDKVLAIIGNVGTPTAVISIPLVNEHKILLFGAFTGADLLRKTPPDRYVINFRSSYKTEIESMVKNLIKNGVPPSRFAFFTQNDAYGNAGYRVGIEALKKMGYQQAEQLPHGRFTRNTTNVEEGLADILDAPKKPKAIIMVGTYTPNAKFIQLAKRLLPNTYFLNVSFTGSQSFADELNQDASLLKNRVIITQVVPHTSSNLPAMKEYRSVMNQYSYNLIPEEKRKTTSSCVKISAKNEKEQYAIRKNAVNTEGYLVAKLFVKGLKQAAKNGNLTREGIIDAFHQFKNIDIGVGEKISFSEERHQALDVIWPTIYDGTQFIPFKWEDLQ